MTLGNKIRKYRKLKDLTQKELGLKVGFSAETADSRIRKYESDSMAPKTAIRTKLAEALDIDISALSDINVSTYEDVMRVLFQFEDTFGMDIEKRDGSTYLYFNDDNVEIRTLITYMNIWKSQKKLYSLIRRIILKSKKELTNSGNHALREIRGTILQG